MCLIVRDVDNTRRSQIGKRSHHSGIDGPHYRLCVCLQAYLSSPQRSLRLFLLLRLVWPADVLYRSREVLRRR